MSAALICAWVAGTKAQEISEKMLVFRGMSDASAAVSLGDNLFVVGDNETNVLRVYRTDGGERPVSSYDVARFLEVDPNEPETNIEGATKIGDRVYWITSHGRNKDGKLRSSRFRFFATTCAVQNGVISLRPVGVPCKTLMHQMVRADTVRYLGLDQATRFDDANLKKKQRQKLAPKEQGLNIEALSASADGRLIYIGFRNPRPPAGPERSPHALVVPLENPGAVVESGAAAVFGTPILWDLGGFGLRSMEYSEYHRAYFVVAGPHDGTPRFALYRWSGQRAEVPVLLRRIDSHKSRFTPEALVPFRDSAKLLLLSDDGTVPVRISGPSECLAGRLSSDGSCLNKYLADLDKRTFRGIWIEP
jgi:hypothetical protein